MPTQVGRPCLAPGCPAIVTDGAWCKAHRPAPSTHRNSPSVRGYDKRWQRIRAAYLARHPLCVACRADGRVTEATEVDHIMPLAMGGTHSESNLQALCKSCHSRKTAKERGRGVQISGPGGRGTAAGDTHTRPRNYEVGVGEGDGT
jgi:5-methylcytosine-specific restriction protein A